MKINYQTVVSKGLSGLLMDMVMALVMAVDPKDKERAYRNLEKVGVDRRTADIMAAEFFQTGEDEAPKKTAVKFRVYEMDMFWDGDGWTENDRHSIGELTVDVESVDEVNEKLILEAMTRFKVKDLFGNKHNVITTTDRRTVYAEDFYDDGTWWEVGTKKNHRPLFGLKLIDDGRD